MPQATGDPRSSFGLNLGLVGQGQATFRYRVQIGRISTECLRREEIIPIRLDKSGGMGSDSGIRRAMYIV